MPNASTAPMTRAAISKALGWTPSEFQTNARAKFFVLRNLQSARRLSDAQVWRQVQDSLSAQARQAPARRARQIELNAEAEAAHAEFLAHDRACGWAA